MLYQLNIYMQFHDSFPTATDLWLPCSPLTPFMTCSSYPPGRMASEATTKLFHLEDWKSRTQAVVRLYSKAQSIHHQSLRHPHLKVKFQTYPTLRDIWQRWPLLVFVHFLSVDVDTYLPNWTASTRRFYLLCWLIRDQYNTQFLDVCLQWRCWRIWSTAPDLEHHAIDVLRTENRHHNAWPSSGRILD